MRTLPPILALTLAGCAGAEAPGANAPPAAAAASPGIDVSALDTSVEPCDDFYQFACGGWLQRTEIPADRSSWGTFYELDERNDNTLRQILEEAAAGKLAGGDPYVDKIGSYYAACMDEAKIEVTAAGDLAAQLKRIDAVSGIDPLARELAAVHLAIPGTPMFNFAPQQDFADATKEIALLDQGGLGLPDREYYLATDEKHETLRKQYLAHVQRMFELAGEPAKQAAADAQTVMKIEHHLAGASMSRVDRRDPKKIYHRLELKGIKEKAPRFPWAVYLQAAGRPDVTEINVAVPGFFAALSEAVEKTPLADWKTYLRWHVIHGAAPSLSKAFVDENFAFYDKTLNGTPQLKPRWKRCVASVDLALGEAVARPFVRRTFGEDGKAKTRDLITTIEQAMGENLKQLSWMDPETRAAADDKLTHIENMVGYPDRWRNYDALEISRESHFANKLRAAEFESRRQLAKIGKPVDRSEWEMTPPQVNAYYDPSLNQMVFPAGILEPPFFNRAAVVAVNYGGIGMVMGHELTHGFDDEGRQFDAKGNLRDWWSPSVGKEFEKRAACVAEQYDGYVAVDDLHLNGKLTLGENIADLGGLKLTHAAYVASRAGKPAAIVPGSKYTDEQLLFIGLGQIWCGKRRPENERLRVATDPHSPPRFRVNGPVSNSPDFQAAFQCKEGSKMVRKNRCQVW